MGSVGVGVEGDGGKYLRLSGEGYISETKASLITQIHVTLTKYCQGPNCHEN